ncbi:DUF2617 family protein [Micromonospora echinofusca]|uniref:DUF2617 family protein n=1 Tax=Micromonospora echinofusca TaxID=47858 RepID=A0ABS3VRC9_MICEH|nr:DUF2617 family protein [Micromonospora echinofusca]MBO4207052.1 DUF2617 family protein [Micromonospora echinofusca]
MLVSLDTPYADTTAADLSLALDGPERPALHVLTVDLPGRVAVRLRLLGASHQVLLDAPGTSRSETVACLPGSPPSLPSRVEEPDGRYRFAAEVLRLSRAELAARMAVLRTELVDDPYALVGVFPGDQDAITALRVRLETAGSAEGTPEAQATVRWQTWHAYPQTGELVQTETAVNLS